uniref:ParB domain-containing protein n=1 Tax=Caenorhabditis japonica TaxID=281687 RepID=A0A8R1E7G4_CAEJA
MFNHSTSTKETDMTAPVNHEQKQRPAQKASCKACVVFELGAVSATPAAIEVLASNEVDFVTLIRRHARGDFGNVCPDDAQSNREAIENGSCIVSSYPVGNQDLVVSPKNVRDEPGDVTALAASIAAVGLLQNLVVSPTENGTYQVDAGGRRFAALTLLAREGKIEADAPVSVLVIDANDSTTASLTENVQREAMNPVDELNAFKQLVDEGFTIDRVADTFGVTPLVVQRRLKLVAAAPELLELHGAGEISTDQMIALCATDDHEVQVKVWETHGGNTWNGPAKPADLRRAVLTREVEADRDHRVAFIGGIAPYEAAGGDVRRDLFSTDGQGAILTDPELLDKLVADKLQATKENLLAEGWGWVEIWPTWDYSAAYTFGTLPMVAVDLPEEAASQIAALREEAEQLETEQEQLHEAAEGRDDDELTDEEYERDQQIDERKEAIAAEIEQLEGAHKQYAPEAMASAGVILCLQGSVLRIERGKVKAADRKNAAAALGDAGAISGGRETESAGRPKGENVSDALRRSLLGHRNLAVQTVVAERPDAAKILLACWTVKQIRDSARDVPTDLSLSNGGYGYGTRTYHPITDEAGNAKADAFVAACKAAIKELPTADGKLWDALAEMKPAQLDKIIALGVALTVSVNEEHKGLTAKLLETLDFDMAEHFEPTADNYLGRVSKPLIVEALTEAKQIKGEADSTALLAMKKGALAAEAEKRLAGTGWVPKGIRSPKQKAKKQAEPKAKAEPKGKPAAKTKPAKAPPKAKAAAKAEAETAQNDPQALAEQLTAATRSGSLSAAYSVLQAVPGPMLKEVGLRSGFAADKAKKPRDVMAFLLPQVAEATRHGTDGHGLRKIAKAAPQQEHAMHHPTHGRRNPLAVKPDPAHAAEACRILIGAYIEDPSHVDWNDVQEALGRALAMSPNVRHIESINELRASHLPNIGDLTAVTRADGIKFIVEACAEQEGRYYRVFTATGEEACWGDCIGWATATSLREAVNRIRLAHIRNIVKLLESARYRHDMYQVFSDCMEAMAISFANAVDLRQRDAREARYLEIVRRYERDVIETFPKILAEVTMAMEAAPGDVLGTVFGQLELHNTARGQFFTPYEVCRLMARLQIGDGAQLREIVACHGFALAQEPACGAGAMVIALAQEMQDAGINYQRHLHVTAIDVDPRAVHMAYVQFSLMHIPAVVIV